MKPKKEVKCETVSEKLIIFMYRHGYSRKYLAHKISMTHEAFYRKLDNNDFGVFDIQNLNRITKRYGIEL